DQPERLRIVASKRPLQCFLEIFDVGRGGEHHVLADLHGADGVRVVLPAPSPVRVCPATLGYFEFAVGALGRRDGRVSGPGMASVLSHHPTSWVSEGVALAASKSARLVASSFSFLAMSERALARASSALATAWAYQRSATSAGSSTPTFLPASIQ